MIRKNDFTMDIKPWTTISSRYIIRRPWLTARCDKARMPNGKIHPEFYVLEYPDWVNVIAVTAEGRFVMVRQFRYAMRIVATELCAGVMEDGETPLQAAQRELLEETGYAGGEWSEIMTIGQNPSSCTNLTHCFVASGVHKVAGQHLDATEDVQVVLLSAAELRSMLVNNEMRQALMAAPLWRYFAEQSLL